MKVSGKTTTSGQVSNERQLKYLNEMRLAILQFQGEGLSNALFGSIYFLTAQEL